MHEQTFRLSNCTPHAFNNFLQAIYVFYFNNLTYKTMRNKTINNEITDLSLKITES